MVNLRSGYRSHLLSAAAVVSSALLLFLAFPDANIAACAWVMLIPILLLTRRASVLSSSVHGVIAGVLGYAGIFSWLQVMVRYNTGSSVQGGICLLALGLYLGLYLGAWGGATALFSSFSNMAFAAGAASVWVSLEYARTYFLTGFPWALLGYSQWRSTALVQISSVTGVYGVSFLIVFVNALLFRALVRKKPVNLLAAAAAVGCVALSGALMMRAKLPGGAPLTVAVLQGNVDQYKKWDAAYEREIMTSYSQLARDAALRKPDVIIWPETAVPGFLPLDAQLQSWVTETARETASWNLVGTPIFLGKDEAYNGVMLLDPRGLLRGMHRKTHLVPFGEYVPLRRFLEPFFGILNTLGDFKRGKEYLPLDTGRAAFGTTICSENFFGDRARRMTNNGATVLVNQTNDAWFFDTAAPRQHFIMNIFRAVENRRPVVVCGNTGVSGVIDAMGKVASRYPPFVRGYFTATVVPSSTVTFYDRHGDIFAVLCIIAALVALAAAGARKLRSGGRS